MATEHDVITDPDIHEPKGVAAANAGEVYIADGAASGDWTALNNANKVYCYYTIDDVSTAASHWIVPGIAGDITSIKTVLHGAIATADAGLTFEIGGTLITSSAITITQSGSAAGDVDSSTPSAANTIAATDAVEIITDGASTNTVKVTVTIEVDVS